MTYQQLIDKWEGQLSLERYGQGQSISYERR